MPPSPDSSVRVWPLALSVAGRATCAHHDCLRLWGWERGMRRAAERASPHYACSRAAVHRVSLKRGGGPPGHGKRWRAAARAALPLAGRAALRSALAAPQVDVTAAEASASAAATADATPQVKPEQVAASTQMVGMAVKQLTAGWSVTGDVWASIHAGVARLKPHKAHVRRPAQASAAETLGAGVAVGARPPAAVPGGPVPRWQPLPKLAVGQKRGAAQNVTGAAPERGVGRVSQGQR